MVKKIVFLLASVIMALASEYTLDTSKSEVYYDAKKDQFFSTYTVIGLNKTLSGSLQTAGATLKGNLKIDVLKFVSDSEKRDENVAEHMNAPTQPFVTFTYIIANNTARGEMSINGVTQNISFPVSIKESASELSVDGNITVKYTDFGMETPSNFILSAHDELVIGARLYFKK